MKHGKYPLNSNIEDMPIMNCERDQKLNMKNDGNEMRV